MMEAFTLRCIDEAEGLGHNGIGCEHVLLGLLANEGGLAADVLTAHGLTLDAVRRRTTQICGDDWEDVVRWTHSPRAMVVLRLSEIEAERLDQDPLGEEHVLLAMMNERGGIPKKLFAEFGVNVARMREHLLDALEVSDDARATYLRQRMHTERTRQQRAQDQG